MAKIKTYCYGELHEFNTLKDAIAFYNEGVISSDGSEQNRYMEVLSKLQANIEPFCDFDGVPFVKEKTSKKTLTAKQIKRAQEIIREKQNADSILDSLRAKLQLLEEDFKKKIADLISDINKYADLRNDLAIELIKYEKLGFKA